MFAVVFIGGQAIAASWSSFIDGYLGTSHTETVVGEESSSESLYTYKNEDITSTSDLIAWHKDLAERMQEEGSVLLKNEDSALPLNKNSKVTLLGNRSVNSVYGGQIGSSPSSSQNVSLATALADRGFDVNSATVSVYSDSNIVSTPGRLSNSFQMVTSVPTGLTINEPDVSTLTSASAWSIDGYDGDNGAAIVVVGRPSSEAADFYPGEEGMGNPDEFEDGENILGLSINEKAIVEYAIDNFDTVVVLVNSDSAMELDWLEANEGVDAILWIGAVGNYGFYGVADLLNGDATPSGHLPDTYASDSTSSPAMVNFGLFSYSNYASYSGNSDSSKGFAFLDEQEGIYTGYRYYETRYEDTVYGRYNATSTTGSSTGSAWNYADEVTYTFGYGLSYTTFNQEIVKTSVNDGIVTVEVEVTNTGAYSGKDVVQIYVQTPYTDYDRTNSVEKSSVQLAGFEKTEEIEPGDSVTVTVEFDLKYIASYDYINAKTYILDAGEYYLAVGNGAHEALNNILAYKYEDGDTGVNMDAIVGSYDAGKATTFMNLTSLDKTTYATSNGTTVTNQLDDMNLNYWTGDDMDTNQLSRSDWSGTWPKGYTVSGDIHTTNLTATSAMITELTNDVYDQVYAEALAANPDWTEETEWDVFSGLTIGSLKGADYDDERWDTLLASMSLEEAITFYITGQNQTNYITSIGLSTAWVQDGPLGFCNTTLGNYNDHNPDDPAYMAEDDAYSSYRINDLVTEVVLGASFSKDLLYEMGELLGTDSLYSNSTIIWAPGLNTHRTPYNGRNHEYYSEDSMLTNYLGAAVSQGALKYGCIVAPKHFAFNDQETNRTGVSVFMNEQRAREIELRAFQGAFEEGGAMGTMTAFNRAGVRYASAHYGLMTNILKGEWGFTGYAVTDMINGPLYMRADTSLMAGTTILDTSSNATSQELLEAIMDDNVAQNALKEAMHANLWVLANSNAMNGIDEYTSLIEVTPWWEATIISLETIFIVLSAAGLIGYAAICVIDRKKNKKEEA